MATKSGDRSAYFPAIEQKYGKPVAFWLKELGDLTASLRYFRRFQDEVAQIEEESFQ